MECTRGSDTRVRWSRDIAFLSPFHHSPSFSSFYYFDSNFWYIDMHPTLAGLYPFLLGSPARCAFLSYLCLYICLGSPARSRLSPSTVALTEQWLHLSSYRLVLSLRFLETVKFSVTTAGNVLPPDILRKMKISHLLHIVYHAEVFHMTFMFCQVLPDPFWQLPGNCQFLAELGSAAEFCPQH